MNNYSSTFLLAIAITMFAGCQDHAWTQVSPYDKGILDEERQSYIDRDLIISRDAWLELEIEDVRSPDDFSEIFTTLPNGVETRYNEASSRSIFEYAILVGRSSECVEYLIGQGADIEQRDFQGRTPLHTAVMRGDVDNVRVLLEHHADPNASDIHGYMPIFQCVIHTDPEKLIEMYRLLVEYGANSHVYRVSSERPSEYATPYDYLETRSEEHDLPEVKSLLSEMIDPPGSF